MADEKKPAEQPKPTQRAADQVTTEATNTDEARKQSEAVLRQQEEARPEPSQEEADEIRARTVTAQEPAKGYKTRESK